MYVARRIVFSPAQFAIYVSLFTRCMLSTNHSRYDCQALLKSTKPVVPRLTSPSRVPVVVFLSHNPKELPLRLISKEMTCFDEVSLPKHDGIH